MREEEQKSKRWEEQFYAYAGEERLVSYKQVRPYYLKPNMKNLFLKFGRFLKQKL